MWYEGKTLTACANDLHGPYLGRDGMIYWCKGAFAQQEHVVAGKPWTSRAAHIFRQRTDGSGFEPVMTGGMDNPVATVQTSRGERFFTSTFVQLPEAGHRDGLVHAVFGGVWGKDNSVLDGHRRTGELMPVLDHFGASAPCGMTVYSSRVFGDDAFDNLFVCHFNLHKVTRHQLIAQGSTFTSVDTDLVWSTSIDFHPTDVLEDADGSLLVANTGGWYKICCPTSQLAKPDVRGAIYRVRKIGATVVDDAYGKRLDWAHLAVGALTELLGDACPAVRRRATLALRRQGEAAVAALAAATTVAPSADARCNVLWTLAQIPGEAARGACRAALADRDVGVRAVAAQLAALWSDQLAAPALRALLADHAPVVRRVAVEALGRCGAPGRENVLAVLSALTPAALTPAAAAAAVGGTEHSPDRMLEHAFIYALESLLADATDADLAALWAGLPDQHMPGAAPAWRAVLIALDQAMPARLPVERVVPLLASPRAELSEAAQWIVRHRPDWDEALVLHLQRLLADPELGADRSRAVQALIVRLAAAPGIRRFLSLAPLEAEMPVASRALLLSAMSEVSVVKAPEDWAQCLAGILAGDDAVLIQAAVLAARRLPFTASTGHSLGQALMRIGADAGRKDALRLAALAAVPGGLAQVPPPLFELLRANLAPAHPVARRAAAVSTLLTAALTREQKLDLLANLKTCGPLELGRLLPLYAGAVDQQLGLALIATLRMAAASASLRPEQLRQTIEKHPPAVQAAAAALLATLNQDAQSQAAHLDELMQGLSTGDERRGQEVFNSPRAGCTACHTIGYVGGKIGPDLTGVGKVRSERDLLESVVYPSASFVRSYEPMIVQLTDGQFLMGNIKSEGGDFIVLNLPGGLEQRVNRANIAELSPGTVSLMQAGFDKLLNRQELADLIAFLKGRK